MKSNARDKRPLQKYHDGATTGGGDAGGGGRADAGSPLTAENGRPGHAPVSVTAAVGENGKRQGLRPPRAARQTKPPSTINAECAPAPEGGTYPEGKIRTTKDGRPWPAEAAASFPPDDSAGGSITPRCWDTGHCIRPSTHPLICGTNELPVTVARRQQRSLAGVGRPACRMVCNLGPGWRCVAEWFAPV